MPANSNAVLYARVSTTEQAQEGISLDAQSARLRSYCEANGLTELASIREEGISGAKPLAHRSVGGRQLTQLVKNGSAKHIVAWKLDRLFRDAADALTHTRIWDRCGVSLHLLDMGGQSLNTSSAVGRLFLSMTASFAEFERNQTAERTSSALQYLKATRRVYGLVPYGFTRTASGDLVDTPNELNEIAQMRANRLAGWSYRRIAQSLNSRAVPTKCGGRWHPSTIHYLLTRTHST